MHLNYPTPNVCINNLLKAKASCGPHIPIILNLSGCIPGFPETGGPAACVNVGTGAGGGTACCGAKGGIPPFTIGGADGGKGGRLPGIEVGGKGGRKGGAPCGNAVAGNGG